MNRFIVQLVARDGGIAENLQEFKPGDPVVLVQWQMVNAETNLL